MTKYFSQRTCTTVLLTVVVMISTAFAKVWHFTPPVGGLPASKSAMCKPCTQDAPCHDIESQSACIVGGDEVYFQKGIYRFSSGRLELWGESQSRPITISAYSSDLTPTRESVGPVNMSPVTFIGAPSLVISGRYLDISNIHFVDGSPTTNGAEEEGSAATHDHGAVLVTQGSFINLRSSIVDGSKTKDCVIMSTVDIRAHKDAATMDDYAKQVTLDRVAVKNCAGVGIIINGIYDGFVTHSVIENTNTAIQIGRFSERITIEKNYIRNAMIGIATTDASKMCEHDVRCGRTDKHTLRAIASDRYAAAVIDIVGNLIVATKDTAVSVGGWRDSLVVHNTIVPAFGEGVVVGSSTMMFSDTGALSYCAAKGTCIHSEDGTKVTVTLKPYVTKVFNNIIRINHAASSALTLSVKAATKGEFYGNAFHFAGRAISPTFIFDGKVHTSFPPLEAAISAEGGFATPFSKSFVVPAKEKVFENDVNPSVAGPEGYRLQASTMCKGRGRVSTFNPSSDLWGNGLSPATPNPGFAADVDANAVAPTVPPPTSDSGVTVPPPSTMVPPRYFKFRVKFNATMDETEPYKEQVMPFMQENVFRTTATVIDVSLIPHGAHQVQVRGVAKVTTTVTQAEVLQAALRDLRTATYARNEELTVKLQPRPCTFNVKDTSIMNTTEYQTGYIALDLKPSTISPRFTQDLLIPTLADAMDVYADDMKVAVRRIMSCNGSLVAFSVFGESRQLAELEEAMHGEMTFPDAPVNTQLHAVGGSFTVDATPAPLPSIDDEPKPGHVENPLPVQKEESKKNDVMAIMLPVICVCIVGLFVSIGVVVVVRRRRISPNDEGDLDRHATVKDCRRVPIAPAPVSSERVTEHHPAAGVPIVVVEGAEQPVIVDEEKMAVPYCINAYNTANYYNSLVPPTNCFVNPAVNTRPSPTPSTNSRRSSAIYESGTPCSTNDMTPTMTAVTDEEDRLSVFVSHSSSHAGSHLSNETSSEVSRDIHSLLNSSLPDATAPMSEDELVKMVDANPRLFNVPVQCPNGHKIDKEVCVTCDHSDGKKPRKAFDVKTLFAADGHMWKCCSLPQGSGAPKSKTRRGKKPQPQPVSTTLPPYPFRRVGVFLDSSEEPLVPCRTVPNEVPFIFEAVMSMLDEVNHYIGTTPCAEPHKIAVEVRVKHTTEPPTPRSDAGPSSSEDSGDLSKRM